MRGSRRRSALFPYTTLFRSVLATVPPLSGVFSSVAVMCPHSLVALASASALAPPTISLISCVRSEEHTSELQSHSDLVCRLLLEKKNELSHHFDSLQTVHRR